MKLLLLAFTLLNFTITHASIDNEVLNHKIIPGSYHKSGVAEVSVLSIDDGIMRVLFKYRVVKRLFVPVSNKYLNGQIIQQLPEMLANEAGYLELKRLGQMRVGRSTLYYQGTEDIGVYKDAHKMKIVSDSGKWGATMWYHPSAGSVGWIKSEFTKFKIPVISKYTLVSYLVE